MATAISGRLGRTSAAGSRELRWGKAGGRGSLEAGICFKEAGICFKGTVLQFIFFPKSGHHGAIDL